MDATVTDFDQRARCPWLAGEGVAARFAEAWVRAGERLDATSGPVLVAEPDRVAFLAAALASIARARPVFFANPNWGADARAQAVALLPRGLTVCGAPLERETAGPDAAPGQIMIPTGGTGGRIKFAVHTVGTLTAAVDGYARYWEQDHLHAVCPMPVCHIGGFMLAWRTWWTGGRLWLIDTRLAEPPPDGFPLDEAHVSIVGTSLHQAADETLDWLRRTRAVLLGGGPPRLEWLQTGLDARLPLYVAYGLTEAAATVALGRVAEPDPGTITAEVLPHWAVSIGGSGEVRLQGPALFLGYHGEPGGAPSPWDTGDRGELDPAGRLRLKGRRGRVIITGGRNVDADWLADELLSWPEITDALVYACPDAHWGEAVHAAVVTCTDAETLSALARRRLSPECRPKHWRIFPSLPRTMHGKADWEALLLRDEKEIGESQ